MQVCHRLLVRATNAPTTVARIALLFSRRGVSVERLHMRMLEDGTTSAFDVSARCDAEEAGRIEAQLRRLVEVIDTRVVAEPARIAAHETPDLSWPDDR